MHLIKWDIIKELADERHLVISSLPLGDESFDALLTTLANRLPDEVLDVPPASEAVA